MLQAFFGLLAVLVAAAVTIHWQRLKQEADGLREDFRNVVNAGATFYVAVGACVSYLDSEGRQGERLWEYQRKGFETAMANADHATVELGSAVTILHSSATMKTEVASTFFHEAQQCGHLLDRIAGWAPHPGDSNARMTFIPIVPQGDLRRPELAAALKNGLNRFSNEVDNLSRSAALEYRRLYRRVDWLAYGVYFALFVAVLIAGLISQRPRANWVAHVQDERVVWTDATSGATRVVPLSSAQPPLVNPVPSK